MNKLIEKVFVLNLKSCPDRKAHIIKEFKRVGIANYDIFEATDKDSTAVQKMMSSDFVKKFPPCFRCQQNKCNCENNVLIKHQIGNWCSFINLMKHIVKENYKGLVMVCEDDVKFFNDSTYFFNKALTTSLYNKLSIDHEKPILIRLEQRELLSNLKRFFLGLRGPKFIKRTIMSNACFLVNTAYAESFIYNLKIIDRTSDMYIHDQILHLDNTIQHFTCIPSPAYQLSDHKNAVFRSTIHPKGLDTEDIELKKSHLKKIKFKEFLLIGCPGTDFKIATQHLSNMGFDLGINTMGKHGMASWKLEKLEEYYFENTVYLIQHPCEVIPRIIDLIKDSKTEIYTYIRSEVKRSLGVVLHENPSNLNEVELLELSVNVYLLWNKQCKLRNLSVKSLLEDLTTLSQLTNSQKSTLLTPSVINTLNHENSILAKNYRRLSPNLRKELEAFCTENNYDSFISD